jgi:hypothetical protein
MAFSPRMRYGFVCVHVTLIFQDNVVLKQLALNYGHTPAGRGDIWYNLETIRTLIRCTVEDTDDVLLVVSLRMGGGS